MATGLGAFLTGLAQGVGQAQEMAVRQQQMERDKERMAMEKDRFALEKDKALRDAEMQKIQQEEAQMRMAAAKQEQAFKDDLKTSLDAFMNEKKAGYEAEEVTPDGKTVGFRRFQDGPSAIAEAKARGNSFRPGSLKRVAEMDEIDQQLAFADKYNSVLAKHGKLTPEMMDAARARRKEISSEGALESARYFMATGDVAGAKEMFAKKGRIRIGDDVILKVVPDDFVGNKIVGTRMVNGKEQQVFDMFQDVILPSMSPKAYADFQADMKKEVVKQTGENKRTGMRIASDERIATQNNKAAMDREVYRANAEIAKENAKQHGEKDKTGKELRDIMFPLAEKQASQPGFVFNADYYRRNTIEQLNRARYLYETGKVRTLEEAANAAIREIPYNPPRQ